MVSTTISQEAQERYKLEPVDSTCLTAPYKRASIQAEAYLVEVVNSLAHASRSHSNPAND
ncbi:MAG: hypothetical protein FIA97_01385 [Methylococcaceae bacterium]|nr:hypothetical protein [Methylococcaceae bacterium]